MLLDPSFHTVDTDLNMDLTLNIPPDLNILNMESLPSPARLLRNLSPLRLVSLSTPSLNMAHTDLPPSTCPLSILDTSPRDTRDTDLSHKDTDPNHTANHTANPRDTGNPRESLGTPRIDLPSDWFCNKL